MTRAPPRPPLHGVLVIDKPRGPTSHDAVARVRRALGVRDAGHAGTLDPMATGVLVVAMGEATKLVPWLTAQEKAYEATIALGVETDSLDADGSETRRVPPSEDLLAALAHSRGSEHVAPVLRAALDAERARTRQVPPAFSAIRTGGQRAYARARRGETPDLAAREVHLLAIALAACSEEPPLLTVTLEASKGYYVRALARDLASALGTVAHLTALRRTRSGCFLADEALPLDTRPDDMEARVVPLALAATRALAAARLSETGARDARHGRPVKAGDIDAPTRDACAWLDAHGALVAVGDIDAGGRGRVLRGFGQRST